MWWKVLLVMLLGSVLAFPTEDDYVENQDYDSMKNDTTDGDAGETSMHDDGSGWDDSMIMKNATPNGDASETSMHEDGSGWDYHEGKVMDGDSTETQSRPSQVPVIRAPPPESPRRGVAFSVRKLRGRRSARTTLSFQDVLTNTGGGWQDNHFIVPRSGTYFFTFHAVGGRTSDFTLSLMRGGLYQVTAYGTHETFEHGSNSVVLRLSRGEEVSLSLTQGTIFEHPDDEAYTTFSGFLIF